MARIGFIGLGHMGLPMAINLVKAGHDVLGFDLQPLAVNELCNAGGRAASSLQEAAFEKDIFITMLQTGEQVREVCLGEEGLYDVARDALHIDCSTIDVKTSRELHEKARLKQLLSVDAPVSGGVKGASEGTLTFMVGGEEHAFSQAKPLLSVMGKKIYHTGMAGSGQAAKICNNMILGVSMIAVSEAFVLAEELGLSAQSLFEVVSNSSGNCWVMTQYAPVPGVLPNVPANNDYKPGFTAAMMLKDLLLSQEASLKAGVNTTLGKEATSIYQKFSAAGFGNLDFSAIIKSIK
ncbi:MAG: 3-hydroxyisobutyrate dehydrogenase [Legionella sp.]|nr:3-hydroxyisobutyrate dehydrogenase [Legionella sp.]